MQQIDFDIWLTVAFGTIALLILAIGFVLVIITSKQKELRLRKRQLEELKISEKKYRNLFEYSPAGMIRLNLNWELVDANEAFMNIFKVQTFEDAKTVLHTLSPKDKNYIINKLESESNIKNFETNLKRATGEDFWISLSAAITEEKFIEAVIIDITKRRQTEAQLHEQARLLDQAHDAILVINLDGTIRYWNNGAERLYQYSFNEIKGKNITEIIYKPEQLLSYQNAFETTLQNTEWTGELNQKKKDDNIIITHCRWTLIKNSENKPTGILKVCSDITERKRLEAHILRTQRLESIGIFASGIAHDLNNALSPVLIGINVLKRKHKDTQSKKLLRALESSVRYGTEILYRVLSFVKGVEGTHVLLNTRKLVKDVTNHINQLIPDNVSLQTRMVENLPDIMGDTAQLQQVLVNLCMNARDAMPNGGELIFSVTNAYVDYEIVRDNPDAKEGEYVVFSVSDTGSGIPTSDLHKIFEPFYTTKEVGKGTGLGLSISQGIIKGHKGFMTVESVVGNGSTFKVYIPVAPNEINGNDDIERYSDEIQKRIIWVTISDNDYSQKLVDDLEEEDIEVILANGKEELNRVLVQNSDIVKSIVFDGFLENQTPELIKFVSERYPQIKILLIAEEEQLENIGQETTDKIVITLNQPVKIKKLLKSI